METEEKTNVSRETIEEALQLLDRADDPSERIKKDDINALAVTKMRDPVSGDGLTLEEISEKTGISVEKLKDAQETLYAKLPEKEKIAFYRNDMNHVLAGLQLKLVEEFLIKEPGDRESRREIIDMLDKTFKLGRLAEEKSTSNVSVKSLSVLLKDFKELPPGRLQPESIIREGTGV